MRVMLLKTRSVYGKLYLFGKFSSTPHEYRPSPSVQTMREKLPNRSYLRKTVLSISGNVLVHPTIVVLKKVFCTSSNHARKVA